MSARELQLAEQVQDLRNVLSDAAQSAELDRQVRVAPKGWSHEPDVERGLAYCAEIFDAGRIESDAPRFRR